MINLSMIIITTSTGYGRKLLDLAKIDIDKIKHNGQNDISIFELAKL